MSSDGGRALYNALAMPFAADEIEWRVGQSGAKNGKPWAKVLAFIDARAARRRLNDVVGPANWKVTYDQGPAGGVLATLSVRIGEEWIAKQDGAGVTDIEATKGGISDAFKRVCAVWGIGEYLYEVGESWAVFDEHGRYSAKIENKYEKWNPPVLKNIPAVVLELRGQIAAVTAKSEPASVVREPALVVLKTQLEDLLENPVFTDAERREWMAYASTEKKAQHTITKARETIQERESAYEDMERERQFAEALARD
jgi:hypothetical protein